jgi:hypothetical protein
VEKVAIRVGFFCNFPKTAQKEQLPIGRKFASGTNLMIFKIFSPNTVAKSGVF